MKVLFTALSNLLSWLTIQIIMMSFIYLYIVKSNPDIIDDVNRMKESLNNLLNFL